MSQLPNVIEEAGLDVDGTGAREAETAIRQDRWLTADQKESLPADYRAYMRCRDADVPATR